MLGAQACFAVMGAGARIGARHVPWQEVCASRFLVGALTAYAVARVRGQSLRIVNPREAAIKHVVDSVLPWRLFEGASDVADAGSGAGFPGIPLALVLPQTRFTLLESTQKKARFLESVVRELKLSNVEVRAERAEEWLNTHRVAIVTARAVAPLYRAAALFAPALRGGARILFYKGPDAATEIADAATETAKRQLRLRIVERYELPGALGTRTIVEMKHVA